MKASDPALLWSGRQLLSNSYPKVKAGNALLKYHGTVISCRHYFLTTLRKFTFGRYQTTWVVFGDVPWWKFEHLVAFASLHRYHISSSMPICLVIQSEDSDFLSSSILAHRNLKGLRLAIHTTLHVVVCKEITLKSPCLLEQYFCGTKVSWVLGMWYWLSSIGTPWLVRILDCVCPCNDSKNPFTGIQWGELLPDSKEPHYWTNIDGFHPSQNLKKDDHKFWICLEWFWKV